MIRMIHARVVMQTRSRKGREAYGTSKVGAKPRPERVVGVLINSGARQLASWQMHENGELRIVKLFFFHGVFSAVQR